MKIEIEVTSRETIKPSSPTPDKLSNYQLSFLDRFYPPVFMPFVLFYPAYNSLSNSERSSQLKRSLSEALTIFYPLAGRIVDDSYINCNDQGISYVEAQVRCKISDVISDPIPEEMNRFIPCDLDDVKDLGLVVQVSFFHCGGMAIGIGISHKIADASSHLLFINCWAAISRSDSDVPSPKFEGADLFPPGDFAGRRSSPNVKKEDIDTRRFVFTASMISSLRDKYTNKANAKYQKPHPTRIEALTAFIWSRFMAATQAKDDPNEIYSLVHAVNLRTRLDPPLPSNYFGNICLPAVITIPSLANDGEGYGIVDKMREGIANVNADVIAKLCEGDKQYLEFLKDHREKLSKNEAFNFTSCCRFPLYEADFGWGRPARVGSARLNFKNLVVFIDTKSGDGIEAWINMNRDDMVKFEVDKELLAFVSCPLDAKTEGLGD